MSGKRRRIGLTGRALAGALVALLAIPSAGLAQVTKVGVVTTLEGNVTARRVTMPAPVLLKVKDGVFFQDTVSTGDKSLVRILLGGKAVVTIRELSVLTITEVPGQSTIDLESGKFGLAVAREKMRAGEEIRIRTPNAIAAVHGTVVVTEVTRQRAQLGGRGTAVTTKFSVLRGNIMAQPIDGTTKQPIGTGVSVGAMQAYSGAGSAPPQLTPIQPEQVSQVTSGLHPTGPKGGDDAAQEHVKAQALETAVALIGTLTGITPGTVTAAIVAPTPTTLEAPAPTPTIAPLVPPVADALESQANQADTAEIKPPSGSLSIPAGTSLRTFTGTTVLTTIDPVLTLTGSSLTQLGDNDLISVGPGASLIMAGPMANVIDSVISTGGAFLGIDTASVTSSTSQPFISFDPVTVNAGGSFVRIEQGNLDLAGSLFTDTGGTLALGGSLLQINDSRLAATGTVPLIDLSGTTASGGSILRMFSQVGQPGSTLTLAGPLLSATGSTLNHTSLGSGAGCCDAFSIHQGAELISTTTSPLIQLANSTVIGADVQSGGAFFRVSDTFTGAPAGELIAPAQVLLAGPLLQATNSTITSLFDTLSVTGSTLTSTTTSPLITLSGSTLNAGGVIDPFTGSAPTTQILNIFASGASKAAMSLAGPLLSASASSTINGDEIVQVLNLAKGAALTSTTDQPLVQLDKTRLTTRKPTAINTGFSVFSAAACPSTGCVGLNADGTFATMSLKGPLLSASNGSSVNTSASLVFVGAGGQISVTGSTDPLISLVGGTHAIASSLLDTFEPAMFDLRGRSTATAVETADGVSLTLGTDEPIKHSGGLLEVSGATITSQKAFRLDTALLAASAPLVNLKPDSSLTSSVDALDLVQKAKLTSLGAVVKLDKSSLTVKAGALALVRNGSLLSVAGDFLQLNNGSTLALLNGPVLSVSGNSVVSISGALVNFGGTGNLLSVTNTLCSPSCTSIGGLNVNLVGGASAANVIISNPIKNDSLGSINLSNSARTAVISISGANSKVTISGN